MSFPAATLESELEAKSELVEQREAIAGDAFRTLFTPVKIYQLVDDFRTAVIAELPEAKSH